MGVRREVADPLEDGEAKGLTADERRVVSSIVCRLLSTASARNVHADLTHPVRAIESGRRWRDLTAAF